MQRVGLQNLRVTMNSETKLVLELWEYFRDIIGAGKRADAALHLLRLFEEHGIDVDKVNLEGEDEYLDEALQALSDDEDEDEQNDFDDYED